MVFNYLFLYRRASVVKNFTSPFKSVDFDKNPTNISNRLQRNSKSIK